MIKGLSQNSQHAQKMTAPRLPCVRGAVTRSVTEGSLLAPIACTQPLRPFGPPPLAQGRLSVQPVFVQNCYLRQALIRASDYTISDPAPSVKEFSGFKPLWRTPHCRARRPGAPFGRRSRKAAAKRRPRVWPPYGIPCGNSSPSARRIIWRIRIPDRRCSRCRRRGCPWPPGGQTGPTGAAAGQSTCGTHSRRS